MLTITGSNLTEARGANSAFDGPDRRVWAGLTFRI